MSTLERINSEFEAKNGRVPTQAELIPLLMVAVNVAENKATQKRTGEFTMRVSVKGAVSVYGFGRWPVTLYANQWEKMSELMPALSDFIAENKDKLMTKEQAAVTDEKSAQA